MTRIITATVLLDGTDRIHAHINPPWTEPDGRPVASALGLDLDGLSVMLNPDQNVRGAQILALQEAVGQLANAHGKEISR
ncbi:hypothetical protein [Streptomyces sp. NBC_01304]|uniref:hypothetical protein n=1 Tax=Streptomyces sp. NBC_01304 TaxID=2903818 RepID=UPI002E100143|nr:hypothetical protein OG430_44475 [Streptomyces sp. NBC_01304]